MMGGGGPSRLLAVGTYAAGGALLWPLSLNLRAECSKMATQVVSSGAYSGADKTQGTGRS